MRIGVFGGEFDPPHLGHLAVARAARDQLALDRLLVVPPATRRTAMPPPTPAETACGWPSWRSPASPAIEVSRIELDRGGTSYTVDTLRALAPLGELFLIMGADQLDSFDTWREPDAIRELASLAVAPRARVRRCRRRDTCRAGHGPGRPVVDERPRARWPRAAASTLVPIPRCWADPGAQGSYGGPPC